MGKLKVKNSREDSKNEKYVTRAPKAIVDRDNFFMKPKSIKEKPFEKRQLKKNDDDHIEEIKEEKTKKPFDKKQWRLKKYSNKYKVEKWQEMRKKKIIHHYNKFTKKEDDKGLDVVKIYEKYDEDNSESEEENPPNNEIETSNEKVDTQNKGIPNEIKSPMKHGQKSRYNKILEMKNEKIKKREEILKMKAEREEALKLYRKKKAEKYKRLNKKTKKGQPIMKDRMEMLYEEVQKMCQA